MVVKLRNFQRECVQKLDGLQSGILVAATGSGKTMMGAALSWKEVQRGGRVAFVVPRDNLARQTARTMWKWGLECGYVLGGERENRQAKVQILSYQSLGSKKRSLDWLGETTTTWIVDEAHITAFAQSLHPYLTKTRKLGLTATPWQLGGKRSLLSVFDEVVFAPPPKQLIEWGYLAAPIYFCPKNKGKLDASPEFIYDQWEELAYGEKSFVFAGSIAASDAIAAHFQSQGIATVSVTSKTPPQQVEPIFDKFRSGEITVLVSCNKLAEGCDIPDATCVILANRTESKSGAIQRVGRGARIAPGKTHFKVIDCVGIIKKFGAFDQIEPSLEDFALSESAEGDFPTKECEKCHASSHVFAKVCSNPECKHPFEIEATIYESPGQLQRLTQSDLEERAIAAFHSLLLKDFRNNTSVCEKEFHKQYGYYPLSHWASDAQLPSAMQSAVANVIWRSFKKSVSDRLAVPVQLSLPV